MGSLASDSMIKRVYQCMCSIDPGLAMPAASGKTGTSVISGVSREQLVIFLADTLRGTAEERAPLVMAMSQCGAGAATAVTCEQVAEVSRAYTNIGNNVSVFGGFSFSLLCFLSQSSLPPSFPTNALPRLFFLSPKFLQDLISAVVQILVHRGRLQGWKPERMGDGSLGVKLLAEQMWSELKPTGNR